MSGGATSGAADDSLAEQLDAFTHRHLRHDTDRQKAVLRKLARTNGGPQPLHRIGTVAHAMRYAGERLGSDEGAALAPELTALVRTCAVPPRRRALTDEEVHGDSRVELLEALAGLTRCGAAGVSAAAAEALEALLRQGGSRVAASTARPGSAAEPTRLMIAALEASGSAPAVLACMREADGAGAHGEAEAQRRLASACSVLIAMADGSARVRRQLLDADVAGEISLRIAAEVGRASASAGVLGPLLPAAEDALERAPVVVPLAMTAGGPTGASRPVPPASPIRASPQRGADGAVANAGGAADGAECDSSDAEDDPPPPDSPPPPAAPVVAAPAAAAPESAGASDATRRPPSARSSRPVSLSPLSARLLELGNLLLTDVSGGAREAFATPAGADAFGCLLAASLRGGRGLAERRLRLEAIAALGAIGATDDGPELLRRVGVFELCTLCVSGDKASAASASGLHAAQRARVRGLGGGVRESEDVELYTSCLRLLRRCCHVDAECATSAWDSPLLAAALCDAVAKAGEPPVALLRAGATRPSLFVREVRVVADPVGAATSPLDGWPAEYLPALQRCALELLQEMSIRLTPLIAKPPLKPEGGEDEEAVATQRKFLAVAAAAAKASASAARRQLAAAEGDALPPQLLRPSLGLLTAMAPHQPTTLQEAGVIPGLVKYALSGCRAASSASRAASPGAVESVCDALVALAAIVGADSAAARQCCMLGAINALIEAMRPACVQALNVSAAQRQSGKTATSDGGLDARLLLHAIDLLAALSANESTDAMAEVVGQVAGAGGVSTLLDLLSSCPRAILPSAYALLTDWLRSPVLRSEFRVWRAPPGVLAQSGAAHAAASAGEAAGDGADALRLVLRVWQAAETHPHAAALVRAPEGAARPVARSLLEPLPAPAPLPPWRRIDATRDSGVSSATAAAAATHGAPLHVKVGTMMQLLRRSAGTDNIALPPLPAPETALLVAAEASRDLQTCRVWAEFAAEMELEGTKPVEADQARIGAVAAAGGSRIEGVWSAQEELLGGDTQIEENLEAQHYQRTMRSAQMARGGLGGSHARHLGQGKRSLAERRRGKAALDAMLARAREPAKVDEALLAQARETRAKFEEGSALAAREAAWLAEAMEKGRIIQESRKADFKRLEESRLDAKRRQHEREANEAAAALAAAEAKREAELAESSPKKAGGNRLHSAPPRRTAAPEDDYPDVIDRSPTPFSDI